MFQVNLKSQALFSSNDKSKKLKCRLLFDALRINLLTWHVMICLELQIVDRKRHTVQKRDIIHPQDKFSCAYFVFSKCFC